jgi:Iap family predicted aminopeptidase
MSRLIPGQALGVLLFVSAAWPDGVPVRIQITEIKPEIVQARLESVSRKISERRATLESLFRETGCDADRLSEKEIPHLKDANIVCTMPGTDAATIVVGAHYDLADKGTGAVDDWSGAALLPSLYQSLKAEPRRHTFVFIAFAGEEAGLRGSGAYVKQLSRDELKRVSAMVNLECLGTTTPKVWASRADKKLLELYVRVAAAIGVKPEASNVDNVGDDDSHSFLLANIPVLTIHSVTQDTLKILHSPADKLSAIHPAEYYAAYRLAANYLAALDQTAE